jgi:hypothetical protein
LQRCAALTTQPQGANHEVTHRYAAKERRQTFRPVGGALDLDAAGFLQVALPQHGPRPLLLLREFMAGLPLPV